MDVVALVFCLPRRSPARRRKLKHRRNPLFFYGVICLCALCARMAQSKGREITPMKNRAQKRKKKHTPRTPPKSYKKCHFGSQNGSQNRSRDPLFRSWRPVSCKIDPKTRPRALLGASGGRQKNIGRAQGRPKRISQPFFAVLKTEPPPRQGGVPGVLHLHFGSLFLNIAAGASAGCKNRGSRVSGGHSRGRGEKLKLLQTASKLVV